MRIMNFKISEFAGRFDVVTSYNVHEHQAILDALEVAVEESSTVRVACGLDFYFARKIGQWVAHEEKVVGGKSYKLAFATVYNLDDENVLGQFGTDFQPFYDEHHQDFEALLASISSHSD